MNKAVRKFVQENYEVLMFEQNYTFCVLTKINGKEQTQLDFITREEADQHFEDMVQMPTDISFFDDRAH